MKAGGHWQSNKSRQKDDKAVEHSYIKEDIFMKTKNALISSSLGVVNTSIRLIVSLAMRRVFLLYFSAEYLGMYFLFDSIFGMLIALDCGISSTLFFKIYKPIEENNILSIRSVFALIKLIYSLRALLVAFIGFLIYFFLPLLVKDNALPLLYIKKCYFIYLVCNAANYFVIFYQFFLEAVQKRYYVTLIEIPLFLIEVVFQFLSIIFFHSYEVYLLVTVGTNVIINLGCSILVYVKYPYLRGRKTIQIEDRKDIGKLFKMAFHTFSNTISHYIDTFLISIFEGITNTGLYSNYKTINNSINTFIYQITSSIKDPLRSIVASEDKEKIKISISNLSFLMFWIGGFCCICLSGLSNKFIALWLDESYLLPIPAVVMTALVLYLSVQNFFLVDTYYSTYSYLGDRKSPLLEISTNLFISLILGKFWGITGIMTGTLCYYIVQTYLRTKKLCASFLDLCFLRKILQRLLFYFLIIFVFSFSIACINSAHCFTNKFLDFILFTVCTVVLPNIVFYIFFRKTAEFSYFISVFQSILRK